MILCGRLAPSILPRFLSSQASLSPAAKSALQSIKASAVRIEPPTQLSKKDRNNLQGNVVNYFHKGAKPEFHHAEKNKHGRMIEPMDTFDVVITSSKNNVYITAINKGRQYRTTFITHAGNVGISKTNQRTPETAYRIAENCARKLKRLGVTCASVRFRRLMRVDQCLQAFHSHGLRVTKLTHEPLLPYGNHNRPRKKRRV